MPAPIAIASILQESNNFSPVRTRYEASLAEARAALPANDFAIAWAKGEWMGLERIGHFCKGSQSFLGSGHWKRRRQCVPAVGQAMKMCWTASLRS